MPSFKDMNGHNWHVDINVNTIDAFRSMLQFDLLDLFSAENALEKLSADLALMAHVLYVACHDQAQAAGITEQQFINALRGDVFDAAADAFWQALLDFMPARRRAALVKVKAKGDDVQKVAMAELTRMLEDPKLMDEVRAQFNENG